GVPSIRTFLFASVVYHRVLPSFPTRRSSDLLVQEIGAGAGCPSIWICFTLIQALPPMTAEGASTMKSCPPLVVMAKGIERGSWLDRKSTRLNSTHQIISYAVFCLKKKTTNIN